MTIHTSDPFATPEGQRSRVRRLRGRLPAPVTIWTAGSGPDRAGLTVSSMLVVDGEPGRVIGIVDDESDLWTALAATGRFTIVQLDAEDRQLADRFAGLLPAPGGLFAGPGWRDTPYGPVPDGSRTRVACRLDDSRPYGWGLLVEATIEDIGIGTGDIPSLLHIRGRYHRIV